MKPLYAIFLCLLFPAVTTALIGTEIDQQIAALKNLPDSPEKEQALGEWQSLPALLIQIENLDTQLNTLEKSNSLAEQTIRIPKLSNAAPNLNQLDEHLNQLNSTKDKLQAQLQKLNSILLKGNTRLNEIPSQLTETRDQLTNLSTPTVGESSLSQALYKRNQLSKTILNKQIALFEKESAIYSKTRKTLPLAISENKSALQQIDELIVQNRKKLESQREHVATQTAAEIKSTAASLKDIPELSPLLKKIDQLNEEKNGPDGILAQIAQAQKTISHIKNTKLLVSEKESLARSRLDLLNQAQLPIDSQTGLLLRNQRAILPSPLSLQENLQKQLNSNAQNQLSALTIQQKLTSLPALNAQQVDTLLKEHPTLTQKQIDQLLTQHQELLTSLSSQYLKLNTLHQESTTLHENTIQHIQQYSTFIDERLLWIKSSPAIHLREPAEVAQRLLILGKSLFSPKLLPNAAKHIRQQPLFCTVLFLSALLLLFKRSSLRNKLKCSGQACIRRNCTSIIPTFKALFFTALLALPFPAIAHLLGILLGPQHLLHPGLSALTQALFPLAFLSAASLPQGLFIGHLKIPEKKATLLRQTILFFLPIICPLIIIISSLSKSNLSPEAGRLLYILAMIVAACFIHRLLRPSRSLLNTPELNDSTPLTRFAYYFSISIPITLALLSAFGYFYSALTIRTQILGTLGVIVLSFLLIRFLSRWILVSKRALSISQALRRREAALAEQLAEQQLEEGLTHPQKQNNLPSLEEVKAEAIDVVQVQEQTISLVKLGTSCAAFFAIWAIWSSSLPALGAFDNIKLWGSDTTPSQSSVNSPTDALTQPLSKITSSENNNSSPETELSATNSPPSSAQDTTSFPQLIRPSDGRVSLQDLILSLVFLTLTIIAARNIPGLLSLTFFRKINLGQGGNFALTTTARYLIILFGLIITLGKIGITWSKVQWIAAAITLGIGFGLQEVFANFVAGIILLYERPIRIGDIVTIGNITGKVTQIKIRATTLRQLNNRDLVVPNKEFITGQIINWSLDDSTLRVEAPVGIAYGTDLDLAKSTLLKVAHDHPGIIDEPAPDLVFDEFGDSSLNFTLRGFISHPDNFVRTKSELNFAINAALIKAGIQIPFPQRDLHLRSSDITLPEPSKKDL